MLNSDHNPLAQLRKLKDSRGKFARWISELKEFDFTVQYLPGVDNVEADPFSRNRAASPIQPTSDFKSKIYAVAIENKNFSDQIRSEHCSYQFVANNVLISNGLEITRGKSSKAALKAVLKMIFSSHSLPKKEIYSPPSVRTLMLHSFKMVKNPIR